MILAENVGRNAKTPARRQVPSVGPFGAMNRTSVDPNVLARGQRNSAPRIAAKTHKATSSSRDAHPAAPKTKIREKRPGQMKALKMRGALSNDTYERRATTKSKFNDQDSFDRFPLLESIQTALKNDILRGLKDIVPTQIQRLALTELLEPRSTAATRQKQTSLNVSSNQQQQVLLAAETGSGKTLAYLLPVLDSIKRQEKREVETASEDALAEMPLQPALEPELASPLDEAVENSQRPKTIILLPTAELVEQVGQTAKGFSHEVKLRVAIISTAYSAKVIRNRVFNSAGVDVIVSTPALLASIVETSPWILGQVSHLVVDEADSLFDRSFASSTSAIIDRARPSVKQLIFCSATIPRSLDNYLRKEYPDLQRLTTSNLHAIPRRVQLQMIDIEKDPYLGRREIACASWIWLNCSHGVVGMSNTSKTKSHDERNNQPNLVLVFVNDRDTVVPLSNALLAKGIDSFPLLRETRQSNERTNEAAQVMAALTNSGTSNLSTNPAARALRTRASSTGAMPSQDLIPVKDVTNQRVLPDTRAIVTTDLTSRGIDTLGVKHVVLYDVPHTTIDFIHRLGRAGRMGRRGRACVLVGKDDRKDIVREVREGMFRGQALI